MRSFLVETQFRIVGTNADKSSHVTWRDTLEEAIDLAQTFETGAVYRPDGTLLGWFSRSGKRPRPRS